MMFKIRILLVGITALGLVFCISSCGDASSSSYSDGEGYGEYHNVNTGERQTSYKGSVEQQNDIATLDKMIEEGY